MSKCKNVECNNETSGTKQYCSLSCRSYYNNVYVRKNNPLSDKQKNIRINNIEKYIKYPNYCTYCSTSLSYDLRKNKFCNSSCAALYSNKFKAPRTIESRLKTSKSLLGIRKQKLRCNIYFHTCEVCSKITCLKRRTNKHTCSDKCMKVLLSQKACIRVMNNGTNNFKTLTRNFSYKNIENIKCDSMLECAGIIYLNDSLNASNIERYTNILHYHDEMNKIHYYNPDFICMINDQPTIVEVKMVWNASLHEYYTSQQYKKNSLHEYCKIKGYNYIWLDFVYDIEFKKIYKNIKSYLNGSKGRAPDNDCKS